MKILLNRKFWEGFIIAAIMLVLVQTFLDEYARFAKWSVASRNGLLYAGFIFDIIFSIEFIVRGVAAGKKGGFWLYVKFERGWVDFLSSFPLLILYSGPSLYFLLAGDIHTGTASYALLNVLKVVKAIRITRILRLVRIIKILGKIQNTDSKMAQHHTATAATTAVFTVVVVLMTWAGATGFSVQNSASKRGAEYSRMLVELESISMINDLSFRESCENFLISDQRVMGISYVTGQKYERLSDVEFRKYYDDEDYITVAGKLCTLIISVKDLEQELALHHIQSFFIIVSLVCAFMLIYSRHFAQTVSDVAHVLNAGFRRKEYNLMVKIREEFMDEELYRVARFYNDAYLPAKIRKQSMKKEETGTPLTMSIMADFGKSKE